MGGVVRGGRGGWGGVGSASIASHLPPSLSEQSSEAGAGMTRTYTERYVIIGSYGCRGRGGVDTPWQGSPLYTQVYPPCTFVLEINGAGSRWVGHLWDYFRTSNSTTTS